MQNTITTRQTPFNLIALVVFLIAVALLVGFAAGVAYSKPPSAAISATVTLPSAATTGWVYRYNSLNQKWYALHWALTPTGGVLDETVELQNAPTSSNGCGLNRAEPDC